MSERQFRDLVVRAAPFDDEEHAEAVTTATLRRLSKNLSEGEASDLADRLPGPYAAAVLDVEDRNRSPEPLGEFVDAVSEEEELGDQPRATLRSVFAAVVEYTGPAEVANAADQLPPEYGAIIADEAVPVQETFTDAVREETGLGGEMLDATRATLHVLGQRITRGEAEDVAAYLHGDAADWLLDADHDDAGDFGIDEFLDRVAARAEVTEEGARAYVEEVTFVLSLVVPDRELQRVRDQLPDEYREIVAFVE
ncbi:hypothetical protein JCM17823_22490 [Halorubrum gandharaense]